MQDSSGLFRASSPAGQRCGGGGGGVPGAGLALPSHNQRQAAKHHLREKEKSVLVDMIHSALPMDGSGQPLFTEATAQPGSPSAVWRLLIFDDYGRDIIAPLIKVGGLRELGITLYMHIAAERDPVPGAPAIYLVAPTEANIARIARDSGQRLYEWVYVNFTAQVPRQQLESLAAQLVVTQLPSIRHIKVYDRTLSYVALDNDLFTLMLPRSFLTLNRRGAADADIDAHLNAVVLGISHVLLSLQVLPVIAHSKTGPAEEVARRLSVRLADAQKDRQLVPAPSAFFGRPLLLLVDRASDLATALHHPFSYRGLLVDEADMRLNKCMIHTEAGGDEVFEVDPDRDALYAEGASRDLGAFNARIEAAVKQFKAEYDALAVESTEGVMGGADDGADGGDGGAGAVSRMLASAPLLAEKKRCLDAHYKLASNFVRAVREKHLDSFHGVELGVLRRTGLDREEFTKLLGGRAGSLADRQRLCLIAYLMCAEQGDEAAFVQRALAQIEAEAPPTAAAAPHQHQPGQQQQQQASPHPPPAPGGNFPALQYLKHLRSWSLNARGGANNISNSSGGAGGASSDGVFGWGGFAQQIAKNIVSSLGANAETDLPLTKLVDALLRDGSFVGGGGAGGGAGGIGPGAASPNSSGGDSVQAKLLGTVAGYDPHTKRPVNLAEANFSHVIVFTIGGGSVAEYDDLKRWESARPSKAVTYGCTAIASGEDMLKELSVLGSEMA